MLEAFLPTMMKNNKGHIVAISSIAGVVGSPNIAPYCASKFAVKGKSLTPENKKSKKYFNLKKKFFSSQDLWNQSTKNSEEKGNILELISQQYIHL